MVNIWCHETRHENPSSLWPFAIWPRKSLARPLSRWLRELSMRWFPGLEYRSHRTICEGSSTCPFWSPKILNEEDQSRIFMHLKDDAQMMFLYEKHMDFPWISQVFSRFSQFHLTILEPNTPLRPTEVFPGFLGSIPGKLLGLGAPELDNWIFFNFIHRIHVWYIC